MFGDFFSEELVILKYLSISKLFCGNRKGEVTGARRKLLWRQGFVMFPGTSQMAEGRGGLPLAGKGRWCNDSSLEFAMAAPISAAVPWG